MKSYVKSIIAFLITAIFCFSSCSDDPGKDIHTETPKSPSESPYQKEGLIVKPFATLNGDHATLHAAIINNPYQTPLEFLWQSDTVNGALSEIRNKNDSVANVEIPDLSGDYYYNLLVVGEQDSTWFQTLVTRGDKELHAFDINTDSPPWMGNAIIYEITPYNFVADGTYTAITDKLDQIRELGANTIWLQPVYKSFSEGQGYDVIDYFSLNPAFGTENELKQLIGEAKKLNMRVLFDIPLSQTSIQHPYAKNIFARGEKSQYYDFYQHENEGYPYSSFLSKDESGFMHYFWEDLVVLNYQSEEVQRWMIEACKYWISKFDIDGYRFDAIWGVNARMPSFAKRLRIELKSIKPDVLLLAEDKGSDPEVYELGFDAAYDWTTNKSWVSQWSWEYEQDENENESKTIFNHPDIAKRGDLLRQALFQNEANQFRLLRFMENNDLPRFLSVHGLKRTKMVGGLLFSIPGIPMLYNGQEIGFRVHPYSTNAVFNRDSNIQTSDKEGLFLYYQKLINLRRQYPALNGSTPMEEFPVSPEGAMVSFRRWKDNENFIIVINMDKDPTTATITLNGALLQESPIENDWLIKDILSNDTYHKERNASQLKIPMEGYSVRWLLLQDDQ